MGKIAQPYLSDLKCIFDPKGNIYHALKKNESSFSTFGEAYFTSIKYGETKGWKRHKKMVMNLIVPVGQVFFFVYNEEVSETYKFILGEANYKRLTIPPKLWVAFYGDSENLNLILNIASIVHNPNEAENKDLTAFPIIPNKKYL